MNGPDPQYTPQQPTLGQITQELQAQPGGYQPAQQGGSTNPSLQEYEQTLGELRQLMAPLMMEHAVSPQHQSFGHLLGSIFTMGMLPLAEHEQAARYNAYADQQNRALEFKTAMLAHQMVNSNSESKRHDLMDQLAVLRAQMEGTRLQLEGHRTQNEDYNNAWHRAYTGTLAPPKDANQAQMYHDLGAHESKNFGGRWVIGEEPELPTRPGEGGGGGGTTRLPRVPGGFGMPAAPGSPLDKAGAGPQAGQDTGTPTDQGGPDLGDIAAKQRKAEAQSKADVKTTTDQATANQQFEASAKNIESYFGPHYDQAANNVLTHGMLSGVVGPWKKYRQEKKEGGSPEAAYLDQAKTEILPLLRALEGGIKNFQMRGGKTLEQIGLTKQVEDIVNGRATPGQAAQFKTAVLARLAQLRAMMKEENAQYGVPTTTTSPTSTTTSTTVSGGNARRLSTGKLIMEEP